MTLSYFGPNDLFRPNILTQLEKTGQWLFQPKIDGLYCTIVFDRKLKFYSRNANIFQPTLTQDLPRLTYPKELKKCVILGELEAQRSWAIKRNKTRGFNIITIFDVKIDQNGNDLRDIPFSKRFEVLKNIHNIFLKHNLGHRFVLSKTVDKDFVNEYNTWKNCGGEGAVLKKKNGTMVINKNGKSKELIKIKTFPDS